MIAAAKEAGVILATGHVERFNPAVQKAKELIDDGVIGDIVSAFAKRVGPLPPRIKDVGVAIDLAIHDLDIMNYLFEEDIHFKRELIKHTDQVILLADQSKYNQRQKYNALTLESIDTFITNEAPPKDLYKAMKECGVEVLISSEE